MRRQEHQKDLYARLIENESFEKEIEIFKTIFKDSIWWVSETEKKITRVAAGGPRCALSVKSYLGKIQCKKELFALLRKAKNVKKSVRFKCSANRLGICIPIVQGDRIYGYIIICHSKSEINDNEVLIFTNFIDTLVRELQKERELAKLYQTIRPRAIALSTIHTIRRIISSTLNLDELLTKLARLCLQIFRSEECCILLKSQHKKAPVIKLVRRKEKSVGFNTGYYVRMLNKAKVLSKGTILMKRNKLCVPLTEEDVIGAICVMNKTDKTSFDEFDREILMTLSEQAAIAIKNAKLYKEQENIALGSIKSLAAILAARKPGAYKIKDSLIKIVCAMGKELHLGAEESMRLQYAVILHDAGQIGISDQLFTKPDKLTEEEYDIIKKHPHRSVSIIKHLSFLKPVIPILLYHHENYDGSGYPKGLRGKEIPLGAKIMAIASAFNAMITSRPYRQKFDVASAITEIKKNSGTQFDPHVVNIFLKVIQNKEINELFKRGM